MLVEKFVVVGVQGQQYFLCKGQDEMVMLKDRATTFNTLAEAEIASWKFNKIHRENVKAAFKRGKNFGPFKSVKEFFKWYRKSTYNYVIGVFVDPEDIKNKTGEL